MTITQAQYDDTGIYICKGTNGYGSSQVRIDLFVIDEKSYASKSHLKGLRPRFTEDTMHTKENYFVPLESDLTLSCSALGQPQPEIYWKKNNQDLGRQARHRGSQLQLTYLQPQDAGLYTCVAGNALGFITKNFSVSVNTAFNDNLVDNPDNAGAVLPDISTIQHLVMPNDPENTTVEEGGQARLECKARVNQFICIIVWILKQIQCFSGSKFLAKTAKTQ